MIRIALIDDDRMLTDGVRRWSTDIADLLVVATYRTVDELLGSPAPPASDPIDVVLLDLLLQDGTEPTDNVRRLTLAGHPVLVVSVVAPPGQVADAFSAGARGYLTKSHDLAALADAIRAVAGGGTVYSPELASAVLQDTRSRSPKLSTRERAVLIAYASGMTLNAVARYVGIQPETAKTYLERVKSKYHQVGRPAYTKIDLARRLREDTGGGPPTAGSAS
jgi:two-component system, NarL family, nitrate/nitrite response regulator NarL